VTPRNLLAGGLPQLVLPPHMGAMIFKCPTSGYLVQAFVAEGLIGPDTICIPLDCPICSRPHLIDPKTGEIRDANKKAT
jgi:hypothetical protein